MSAQNQQTDLDKSSAGGEISDSVRKKTTVSSSRRSRKSEGAFRTISEVAKALDVQQHVLRFWETKFSQIRPLKRGGGRRYYRPEDFALIQTIHHLLYTEGYTIKGVQKLLREQGKNTVIENAQPKSAGSVAAAAPKSVNEPSAQSKAVLSGAAKKAALRETLAELKSLRDMLSDDA